MRRRFVNDYHDLELGTRVIESRYPYRENLVGILIFTVMFGLMVPLSLHWARTAGEVRIRGLRITGNAATAVRWSAVGFNSILLVLGLLLLRVRILRPGQEILITRDGVIMPRSRWRTKDVFVRFDEIKAVSLTRHKGAVTCFNLHCAHGKFSIAWQNLMESDFDEITRLIEERIGMYVLHQPKPPPPPDPQPKSPEHRMRLIHNIARSRASDGREGPRRECP
jgi:hypothetical protein